MANFSLRRQRTPNAQKTHRNRIRNRPDSSFPHPHDSRRYRLISPAGFRPLHELQRAESGEIACYPKQEPAPAKAVKPEDSIQNDKVICLECGKEMRQLTKAHLVSHGMSAKEYKRKYGFTMGTPLAAKSLTKARSKATKKRGLPEKLQKYKEARRQAKADASNQAATETVTASKPVAAKTIQKRLLKEKPALTPENSIRKIR